MAAVPDLRVVVVGAGQRAAIAHHIGTSDTPARLVAAVDTTEVGRARAAAAFPGVDVFGDLDEALTAARPDAAVVTTPDDTHCAVASRLLEAGVAVFLEKPMAISVEDCDHLLALAARTGTPLYVGHNMRHASVVRQMRALVEDGAVGEVKAVWCRHFVGNGGDYYFKDWHAERARVGSLLLQKASHDIDVEDVSMVLLDLGDGVTASYEQCHFTPDYWRNYTVIGTHGRMENFGDTPGGVIRVWNQRREWDLAGDLEVPIEGEGQGHEQADALTVAEFLRHVATGAPTEVSALAARDAVAVGALAAASLRDGSTPRDVPALPPDLLEHFARTTTATTHR